MRRRWRRAAFTEMSDHLALEPQGGLVSLERDDTLEAAHKMQYEVEGCIQQPPAADECKTLMQNKYKEMQVKHTDGKGDINGAALSAAIAEVLTKKECADRQPVVLWGDKEMGIRREDSTKVYYNDKLVADSSKGTGDNEIELSQPVDCTVQANEQKISIPIKPLQAYDPNAERMYKSTSSKKRHDEAYHVASGWGRRATRRAALRAARRAVAASRERRDSISSGTRKRPSSMALGMRIRRAS